jgi:membrane-associated phospholipid phosphatase
METSVAIARTLGAHPAVAFSGALSALLLMVLGVWVVVKRVEAGAGRTPLPAQRLLLLRVLLGFAMMVGAGIVFAEMAEALDVHDAIGRFDLALVEALRLQFAPATLRVFALVTRLGDAGTLTVLCILVAGLLLWRGQRTLAFFWVLAVAGNGTLNSLLKRTFERVRPLHDHGLLVADGGWSFPSGHSSGSVVAYGMLAYLCLRFVSVRWQLPVLMTFAAVAFTTGLSRVVLQVHYASDVLAGFASGLLWLSICVVCVEWLHLRPRAQPKT